MEHALTVSVLVPMIMIPILVAILRSVKLSLYISAFSYLFFSSLAIHLEEIYNPLPLILDVLDKIDGNWGDWTSWSKCPVTCEGSNQKRTRLCNDPIPDNGGKSCTIDGSSATEVRRCNENPCPGWYNM